MVMQVTSVLLQEQLDQWDHMDRFGINVPKSFLVHDEGSFQDLFREFIDSENLDRLTVYKYDREYDDERQQMPTNLDTLQDVISKQGFQQFYYLALPYIDYNDFVMCGWVKSPAVDEPFIIRYGIREDHRIPFEDNEEFPCEPLEFDPRGNVPHPSPFLGDIKRIACGFPYDGCRMTWSVTKDRIGRQNSNLCFHDYQIDQEFVRD